MGIFSERVQNAKHVAEKVAEHNAAIARREGIKRGLRPAWPPDASRPGMLTPEHCWMRRDGAIVWDEFRDLRWWSDGTGIPEWEEGWRDAMVRLLRRIDTLGLTANLERFKPSTDGEKAVKELLLLARNPDELLATIKEYGGEIIKEDGDRIYWWWEFRTGPEDPWLWLVDLDYYESRRASFETVAKDSQKLDVDLGSRKGGTGSAPSDRETARAEPAAPLTELQWTILDKLDGKALKVEKLASECKCEPSRLYRNGLKTVLLERGMVQHTENLGYWRPDAPPIRGPKKVANN